MRSQPQAGFSLLEIAVVLIIIGLMAAGTLLGMNLMDGAKVKAVISEFTQMEEAVAIFEQKYNGLPGDLPSAGDLWPNCDATPANCNGNGNGKIEHAERYRAVQQLADAKLIKGTFPGTGGVNVQIGVNVPASRYENAGLALAYVDVTSEYVESAWGSDSTGNVVFHGRPTDTTRAAVMPARHAQEIDLKMDDGSPGTGNIQGNDNTATGATQCYTAATPAAQYRIANEGTVCAIHYMLRNAGFVQ